MCVCVLYEEGNEHQDETRRSLIEKSIQKEKKIKQINADLRENSQLLREKMENLEMEIVDLR